MKIKDLKIQNISNSKDWISTEDRYVELYDVISLLKISMENDTVDFLDIEKIDSLLKNLPEIFKNIKK